MILWLLPHCVKFSPQAFYLKERVEVFAAEALRNPEVNALQFGSPLQYNYCHIALSSAHMLFILKKKLKFLLQRR